MSTVTQTIERLLLDSFSPTFLEVINESHLHAGHRHGGVDSHFAVTIISDHFLSHSRVARHRQVYHVLDDPIKAGVHALKISALTPLEYAQKKEFT